MNIDECPVLNNGYAVPRDAMPTPPRKDCPLHRTKTKTSELGIYPAAVQEILAEVYYVYADHCRELGLTTKASECVAAAEFHIELAAAIRKRKNAPDVLARRPNPGAFKRKLEDGDI